MLQEVRGVSSSSAKYFFERIGLRSGAKRLNVFTRGTFAILTMVLAKHFLSHTRLAAHGYRLLNGLTREIARHD